MTSVDNLQSPTHGGSSTGALRCRFGASLGAGDLHLARGAAGAGEAGERTSLSAESPPAAGGCPRPQKKGAVAGHPAACHLRLTSATERLRFFCTGSILSLAAASVAASALQLVFEWVLLKQVWHL